MPNPVLSRPSGFISTLNTIKRMPKNTVAALICLLLTSCGPVISKQVMSYTDPNINFFQLINNPDFYKGKVVVLGGRIINTTVKKNETWLEILEQPLEARQRPKGTDETGGRFLVRYQDYRDPAVYAPGRSVTIAGEIMGKMVLPLGQGQYSYPVLYNRETYLWPVDYGANPNVSFGFGLGIISH